MNAVEVVEFLVQAGVELAPLLSALFKHNTAINGADRLDTTDAQRKATRDLILAIQARINAS